MFSSKISGSPVFLHVWLLSCQLHICYQVTAATIQMTVLSQQTWFTLSWLRHHNILFSLSDYHHDPNHQTDPHTLIVLQFAPIGWELGKLKSCTWQRVKLYFPCWPTSKSLLYWLSHAINIISEMSKCVILLVSTDVCFYGGTNDVQHTQLPICCVSSDKHHKQASVGFMLQVVNNIKSQHTQKSLT